MNLLFGHELYRNRYFAMRHGHSEANARGLIVSDPRNGLEQYGLSERGRAEVEASLRHCSGLDANCRIISSDFLRARETAEIARGMLGCKPGVETDTRLRERFFGDYEMASNSGYARVWNEDVKDPDSARAGVESASQVTRRVTNLILELEREHAGQVFLLVSHGDALQLLQSAFAGLGADRHREIEHLETAEIREMTAA